MSRPRILLTRSAEGNAAWAETLSTLGAEPLGLPCLCHEPIEQPGLGDRLGEALGTADWWVLTSPRGVHAAACLLDLAPGTRSAVPIAAVGRRTAEVCEYHFDRADLVADPPTGRNLARQLRARFADDEGGRIVITAADRGRRDLEAVFAGTRVEIERFSVYRTVPASRGPGRRGEGDPARKALADSPDALFFASPSAVEGFSNLVDSIPSWIRDRSAKVIAIGPTTAAALRDHDIECRAIAEEPSIEGLWRAFLASAPRAFPQTLPPSATPSPGDFDMSAGSRSQAVFERAQKVLPGGVNSPVRAFRAVGGTPIVVKSAQGTEITSVDDRTYLDFVGSWGPLILGHAHPEVVAAVSRAASQGTTFGAPCEAEVKLAEKVVDAYPGLDQIRCVSSGTEATMSAVRLARGATSRDRVLKFIGSYHGHVDHLMVSAGSGLVTFGQPSSAGVPEPVVQETRVLPLDDDAALGRFFDQEGDALAAVILEPIPANNGLLLQRPDFLRRLRELTEKHGAMLIFDEVISGFRVARGGAAEHYGITPDIACFGKVIGGGLPVGAFGARREIMDHLAPNGAVYQAGTLSGNPMAMAAGLTALEVLEREDGWARLEQLGQALESKLAPVLEAAPVPAQLVRMGSIFWMCLQDGEPPRAADGIDGEGAATYKRVFHRLLDDGITIAPSMYEVGFLSLVHEENHLDRLARAVEAALAAEAG